MYFLSLLRQPLVGSFALVALAAAASAEAADITITDAKIEAGKLRITGTTTTPNTRVRLDGQTGGGFNVTSNANNAFAFELVYLPSDCIVTLQKLTVPSTLGAPAHGVVADCGPRGVSPRGAWVQTTPYLTNDLVTYQGSTWRAKRDNVSKLPAAGVDWDLFAAAGTSGSQAAGVDGGPEAGPLDAPTGPAGGDLAGNYPNPTIKNLAVTTNKIADNAVTTVKIAPGSIGAGRLADNAVTSPKITDGAVTSADILDGTVANVDFATSSVNSATVLNGSITSDDLATGSVNASEIATDAVGATEIADDSIDGGEIVNDSLGAVDLASSSVGSAEIATGAVTITELAGNAVDGSKVVNNSLTTADIAGTDVNGIIQVQAGTVASGRCDDFPIGVGGALAGQAVVVSTSAVLPQGLMLYGQRVPSNGTVTLIICNLSGGVMPALSDFPIRIVTFG